MLAHLRRWGTSVLIITALAACGGGGGGDTSTAAPAPAPAPAPSPPVPPVASDPYVIPAGLWAPAPALLPASGNYIITESDDKEFIGQGIDYTYTNQNALLAVTVSGTTIKLDVKGNERWSGVIALPNTLTSLRTGYFGRVSRISNDPANGVLDWGGEGRGCNTLTGWVLIDKVTIANNVVTELDLSFEQRCGIATEATRARVHWTLANANAVVPASPSPIPPALWRADPAAIPATGSYVFVSGAPDAGGVPRDRLYTRSNANLWISGFGGRATLTVDGDQDWRGEFVTMDAVKQLQVGYYPNLRNFPLHNPLFGGLSWNGDGRICFGSAGWFIVDAVTYTGNDITALDLRFEQACSGGVSTIRGQMRWRAGEVATIVGPVNPAPAGLWALPASVVKPSGSYAYISSETGVSIPRFSKLLPLTTLNYYADTIPVATLDMNVDGYRLVFRGIQGLPQLVPGYYADLKDMANLNPTRGGLEINANGAFCSRSLGWVLVEQSTYDASGMTSVDLRFETTCEGSRDVMHGVIHWVKPVATPP